MKKYFILLPAVLLFTFACSSKKPTPTFAWRVSSTARPQGNSVSIMPIDVRVSVTGKANSKDRRKIWKNATKGTLSLMKVMPSLLALRSYRVTEQIFWSGNAVSPEGKVSKSFSPQDLARSIYTLSWFAGHHAQGALRHRITPSVFRKLNHKSDMTLYVANWYSVKVKKTHGLLEFLKVSLVVVGVAVIVLGVVVGIASIAGKGGGSGGGAAIGGALKIGAKLFMYGAKGLARGIGSIFARTLVRTAGRVAIHTARVATRVAVRSLVENGPLIVDLPPQYVQPAYTGAPPEGNPDTVNPYMGVENGISSMKPTNKGNGFYLAFILVNNANGAVVWDGRIWFPQGSKTNNAQKMIKEVFKSMPLGILSQAPALATEQPVY
jgi:hypothetical protein